MILNTDDSKRIELYADADFIYGWGKEITTNLTPAFSKAG